MAVIGARNEPFSFSSPPFVCAIEPSQQFKSSNIRKRLEIAGADKVEAIKSFLDSLGFFSASCDTVKDTIHIRSGSRSIIDSLRIVAVLPCDIDSVQKGLFPRPYDAGEVAVLAEKTLRFLGSKGYPFARLSITVSEKGSAATAPDASPGCIVTFAIRENGKYLFSRPTLMGTGRTSQRLLRHDIVINEGDEFDLQKIEESKERLALRSWVSSVETGPLRIVDKGENTPALADYSGSVRVPFIVTDNIGLGIDGAIAFQAGGENAGDLSGIFNVSLVNLFHRGEKGLLAYKGEQGYQRLELSLSMPYCFNVSLFSTVEFGLEIKENDYGYLHGEITLTTNLGLLWQWGLALKGHETSDSAGRSSRFEGIDFVMSEEPRPYRAGELSSEVDGKVGSGIVQYNGRQLSRWHIDATVGVHFPFSFRHAVVGRVVSGILLTDKRDTLHTAELYRTGGYKSLRGYSDNEFAFRTVAYEQLEYHLYFNYSGSVFIFLDAGMGLTRESPATIHDAEKLCGYGVGIRIPVKIGDASIEWARKYTETSGWGRIHIAISNNLSANRQ